MFEINNDLTLSFDGLQELLLIYQELDTIIKELKKSADYDCIPFCKKCCGTDNSNIEVSVFEIIPLCIHLWQINEAEYWLDKLSTTSEDSSCVLLNNDHLSISGCRAYIWRPLLCRLFGFSAKRDKVGNPLMLICKDLKNQHPDLTNKLDLLSKNGVQIPIASHYAQKTSAINPVLGDKRYPINDALKLGLELIGLRISFINGHNQDTDDTPPKGGPKPRRKTA